jgi:hypothetical protein
MKITVHIERMILDGAAFEGMDRASIGATLETELVRLIGERGLAPSLTRAMALPKLAAPEMRLAPRTGAKDAAAAIARSLHSALGPVK